MNRSNFGRVSGIVIDVCRPHGAWFDRGELAAIRRFLREGGLNRYERRRRMDAEARRARTRSASRTAAGSLDDVYDVLVGGSGASDVPSRIPRLLVVAVFTAVGGWLLWIAFHPRRFYSRTWGVAPVLLGLVCLYFAWRALEQWARRRR
jgi:Zn-finger nucleic acid-binding protein